MNPINIIVVSRSADVVFQVENVNRREKFPVFYASNGIKIESINSPQWNEYKNTLFVQGDWVSDDQNKIKVNVETFSKIELAVKEYNLKYGKNDTMTKPRLKIKEVQWNNINTKIRKPYSVDLVCFQIVECSGFTKKVNFGGYCFLPNEYANVNDNTVQVWNSRTKDKDAMFFVPRATFCKIEAAVKLLNEAADALEYIKTVTFLYTREFKTTRRMVRVTSEGSSYIRGLDVDTNADTLFDKDSVKDILEVKE